MSRPTIHETMMTVALAMSMRATCQRKRVGCVLLDSHKHIVGTGYNGNASGLPHCTIANCAGVSDGEKCEALHAEWNALLQCRDVHQIEHVYVTTAPCLVCVKMLLNTSATTILYIREHSHSYDALTLWRKAGREHFKFAGPWIDRLDKLYPESGE